MKFIPTWFHGILDYVVGIALIFAPMIFGFSSIGGAAVFIPRLLGVLLIVYSLFTRYELGLFKVISMPYHLTIDFIASLFLALSPWLFGFANGPANSWVPHVVVGIVVILVVLFSQTRPHSMKLATS
jgi:hypothetical protein